MYNTQSDIYIYIYVEYSFCRSICVYTDRFKLNFKIT